jgi:hypothetical protein
MNNRSPAVFIAFLCAGIIVEVSRSQACPAGQYERCVLSACVCLPEIGGSVGQGFEHLKKEIPGQLGGLPLEQWINASYNTARNGAMPIPQHMRQALTGYASEDSMNRVIYKIGDNGVLNLANDLERGGFAAAVTLINLVVFRGPGEASNPSIWAHELTHVDQYAGWGVHSFAIQYARDYNSVEGPAYAKGNGYWAWAQQQGFVPSPATLPPFYPAPSILPFPSQQAFGAFCYTGYGRFGPGPVQPLGAPCFVNGVSGNVVQ